MKKIRIMALITQMAESDDKLFRLFIAQRIFELMDEKEPKKTFKEEYEEARMK